MSVAIAGEHVALPAGRTLAVGALLGVVAALFWPSLAALHSLWLDAGRDTYTHGYFVVAVAAWLLWQRRPQLARALARPRPAALLPLLLLGLAWLFCALAGIDLGHEMLLPPLLLTAVLVVFGLPVARLCVLPIAYLYFGMSVWDYLNPVAQWGTVQAVRLLLQLGGITAFFEGNQVQIAAGTFDIAGGCSGLHFIIVGAALAVLMGELRGDSLRMRLRLVALMLALAVLSNWMRVLIIIVAGDVTHMQSYLVRESHYGFGWCVFAVALLVFFLIERRLPLRCAVATTTAAIAPQPAVRAFDLWACGVAAVVVASVPLLLDLRVAAASQDTVAVRLPAAVGSWQRVPDPQPSSWQPTFPGAADQGQGRYVHQEATAAVELFVAEYGLQQQGGELNGYRNSLAGVGHDLQRLAASSAATSLATLSDSRGAKDALAYTYFVGDRTFGTPGVAQLAYGWYSLLHLKAETAGVVAARSACAADCDAAAVSASEFVSGFQQLSREPKAVLR